MKTAVSVVLSITHIPEIVGGDIGQAFRHKVPLHTFGTFYHFFCYKIQPYPNYCLKWRFSKLTSRLSHINLIEMSMT